MKTRKGAQDAQVCTENFVHIDNPLKNKENNGILKVHRAPWVHQIFNLLKLQGKERCTGCTPKGVIKNCAPLGAHSFFPPTLGPVHTPKWTEI